MLGGAGDILKTEGNTGKEYDYLHQNTFIKLRWDGAKPITETWTIANNGKQAATKNTNQFIKKMEKSSNLVIGWQPDLSYSKAAKFDLNSQDFKNNINKARKDGCNI